MMKVIRNDKRPIWQQLLDQAIHNITSGVWAPGELLIPTRELAHIVGVSRSTIQIVYEELLSRGYTVTSRRGGTRVSTWKQVTMSTKEIETEGPTPPSLSLLDSAVDQLHDWFRGKEQLEVDIDFSPHEPYLDEQFQKTGGNRCSRHPLKWIYQAGLTVTATGTHHYVSKYSVIYHLNGAYMSKPIRFC